MSDDSFQLDPNEQSLLDVLKDVGIEIKAIYPSTNRQQFSVEFRVPNENKWHPINNAINSEEQRNGGDWRIHTCKHYRIIDNKYGYRWNLVIKEGKKDLNYALSAVRMIINVANRANLTFEPTVQQRPKAAKRDVKVRGTVMEIRKEKKDNDEITVVPLIGVGANRNMPQVVYGPKGGNQTGLSSKGAHLIGGRNSGV